jgi:hypothetical protein
MKKTRVSYEHGILTVQYRTHTKICEDIRSARIELKRIINYRDKCGTEKSFFYYTALADMVRDCIDRMIVEQEIIGASHAAHAYC